MRYKSIDNVLEEMQSIIKDTEARGDRIGYFDALYYHVTVAIRDAIEAGNVFENNDRMERLDVVFAERYLDAYNNYQTDKNSPISSCWRLSFDKAADDEYAVMQHIEGGMNAHINLDLGIAVAQVASEEGHVDIYQLHDLKHDYNLVNGILASVVPLMNCKLGALSPVYLKISEYFGPEFVDGMMAVARQVVWEFARRLVLLEKFPDRRQQVIESRDKYTTLLSQEVVYHLGPIYRKMAEEESQTGYTVSDVIAALAADDDQCSQQFRSQVLTMKA